MDCIAIISSKPLQVSLQQNYCQMIVLLMFKNPYFFLISGSQPDAGGILLLHFKICFSNATDSSFVDCNSFF
jgi:hypothetical protein